MREGRPPKPTILKILTGNPGQRPLNTEEPVPGLLDAKIPIELVDEVARAEWKRTIVSAIKVGMLADIERGLAIAHCKLWAQWVTQLGRGDVAANDALKTLGALLRVDIELGFTPTSRSRIKAMTTSKKPKGGKANLEAAREKFFGTSRG